MSSRVLAGHGSRYLIEHPVAGELIAAPRGRRRDIVVGDWVNAHVTGNNSAVIDSLEQRRNLMRRSDAMRSKALAANLDQAAYVIGAEPPYSEELLLRVQLAAAVEGISFFVIANKIDLQQAYALMAPRLALLRVLGVEVFELAAKHDSDDALSPLRQRLAGKSTLLLGQSGMGKSTLLNRLVPQANMRTREISNALSSGKHTTSFTRLFRLEPAASGSVLIDSPGFQVFGLSHLSRAQTLYHVLEFGDHDQRCRFNDCSHRDEPGCAVRHNVESGQIDNQRYRCYREIINEVMANSTIRRKG